MDTFWKSLKRPFFVLAPLADVTDPAFRRLVAECGAPDVTWTEFVSADGLYHTRELKKLTDEENPLVRDLLYTEAERPILAQVFSARPEMIRYAARFAAERGFDGIDINMGCPDRAIEKQGCGAAMMKHPELVAPLVEAAREGAAEGGRPNMGVSIKTRIGYNTQEIDTWIRAVLETRPDALTVHLRTRKEMSLVPAHWECMPEVVVLRDKVSPHTLVIGNGDVVDIADARQKVKETGADGVMLGRAIFGNPRLFTERVPEPRERVAALLTLARYFEELRPRKSFHILRKHVKAFVTGFDNAAALRARLMEAGSADEMEAILKDAIY